MPKAIVLSDDLLKVYYAFKDNQPTHNRTLEHFLNLYKPHLTNTKQLERCGIQDAGLMQSLANRGLVSQSLEELTERTTFKIILDKNKKDYPYVNIFDDMIENNYTSTYEKDIPREKSHKHIKSLLKDASEIFIYDKYVGSDWQKCKTFFEDLIPQKTLFIYHNEGHLNNIKSNIENTHDDWEVDTDSKYDSYDNLHDRYILIDEKIQIILTSGFQYLFDDRKEFTYIIREIN